MFETPQCPLLQIEFEEEFLRPIERTIVVNRAYLSFFPSVS